MLRRLTLTIIVFLIIAFIKITEQELTGQVNNTNYFQQLDENKYEKSDNKKKPTLLKIDSQQAAAYFSQPNRAK